MPVSSSGRSGAVAQPAVGIHWTATHNGGGAIAAAIEGGRLWVAYSRSAQPARLNSGELVGYNLQNGHVTVTVTIGGSPVAVAATSTAVWVANGPGDGSSPPPREANTVLKITSQGKIVSSFRLTNPQALGTNSTSTWAYYGRQENAIIRELDSQTGGGHATSLAGNSDAGALGGHPLAICGDQAYAVSVDRINNRTILSRIGTPASAMTVATVATTPSVASLICSYEQQPVLLLSGATSSVLSGATAYRSVPNPAGPSATLVGATGALWLVDHHDAAVAVSTMSATGQPTSTILTERWPSSPIAVANAGDLWLVLPAVAPGTASIKALQIVPAS